VLVLSCGLNFELPMFGSEWITEKHDLMYHQETRPIINCNASAAFANRVDAQEARAVTS